MSGRLHASFLMLAISFSAACQTPTPASHCFLVDLQQKDGTKALPILDGFASLYGLTADRSHPLGPRYQLPNGDELLAEHLVSHGYGGIRRRARLVSVPARESQGLVASFDSFVEANLSKAFPTRRCFDVPGYGNPIVVSVICCRLTMRWSGP